MMRKILLCALLGLCTIVVKAQEMTTDEVARRKKEMNDIKRSEEAVCAEIVKMVTDDGSEQAISQAQHQSMQKLQAHVVEIFANSLQMSKEDVQEIWDTIEDKCQNVEITAGGVTRAFCYVSKEALASLWPDINLFPKRKKKQEEMANEELAANTQDSQTAEPAALPVAEVPSEQKEEDVVTTVVQETAEEKEVTVVQDVKTEDVAAVVEEEKAEQPEEQVAVEEQTVVQDATSEEQPVDEPEKGAVVETPAALVEAESSTPVTPVVAPVAEPTPATPVVQVAVPELCQTMLNKKNYETLLRYLNEERAYENLIFGPERRMARVAECYIVIINKTTKEIITILDKGVNDRMNFVTGEIDSFANYQLGGDYLAIFVQKM